MTPEQQILADLIGEARRSADALVTTIDVVGDFPADAVRFDAMPPMQRLATTALLKQVEQLEGALHGAFRAALRMMGVSLKGLYPLDIGHRMAELDVLDDGETWLAAVKLRNELVHEYPSDRLSRLIRTRQAYDLVPTLRDAVARLDRLVTARKLLDL